MSKDEYFDYSTNQPIRDGKEICDFLNSEIITVNLCEKCIRVNKGDIVTVGNYTNALKCYFCDETEVPLRKCRVEL